MIFKMWILLSNTNLNITGCLEKISSIQKKILLFYQDFVGKDAIFEPNSLKLNQSNRIILVSI